MSARNWIGLGALGVLIAAAACKKEAPPPPAAPPPAAKPAEPPPVEKAAEPPPVDVGAAEAAGQGGGGAGGAGGATVNPALLQPGKLTEKAPAKYKAVFTTSKGEFVVEVTRDWSPAGADRFYNLVKHGFFNDVRFFRAIKGFMVQFGISGDPALSAVWREANIPDDPVKQSNKRGFVTFAKTGMPNSRSTQIFINYSDGNARLDEMGFSPFGKVVKGMEVVDMLYTEYGEGAPGGLGPNQGRIQMEGNKYLDAEFPKLDYVKFARIAR